MNHINKGFENPLFTKEKKTWNIQSILLAVSLSVWSSLNPSYVQWEENSIHTSLKEKESVQEVKSGSEMFSLFAPIIGKERQLITIDKNELNTLYQGYIKLRWTLWQNLDMYIKNKLLHFYVTIIEKGYSIQWFQELDELVTRIHILSDGEKEIKLWKSMPQNSEFTSKIMVTWKLIDNKILLEEKSWISSFWENDSIQDTIDISKVYSVLRSDFPWSYDQALKEIASTSNNYLLTRNELIDTKRKISDLEFQVESLTKKLENMTLEREEERKKNISDIKKTQELSEKRLQQKIESLTEKFNHEKNILEEKWKQKDEAYKKLQDDFEKEKRKIFQEYQIQKQMMEDRFNTEFIQWQKKFDAERQDLLKKIDFLQNDLKDLKNFIETQNRTFQKEREEAQKSIDELNRKIMELSNEWKIKNSIIEDQKNNLTAQGDKIDNLEKMVDELTREKQLIISQNSDSFSATNTMLTQIQASLEANEKVIIWLREEINTLKKELKWKTEEVNTLLKDSLRLKSLEKEMKELNPTEKIKMLNEKVLWLQETIEELTKKNKALNLQMTQYQKYKKAFDDYSSLQKFSQQQWNTIKQLEIKIKQEQSKNESFQEDQKRMQQELDKYKAEIKSQNVRILEMTTTMKSLEKWTQLMWNDMYLKEIQELHKQLSEVNGVLQKRTDEAKKYQKQAETSQAELLKEQLKHKKDIEKLRKQQEKEMDAFKLKLILD